MSRAQEEFARSLEATLVRPTATVADVDPARGERAGARVRGGGRPAAARRRRRAHGSGGARCAWSRRWDCRSAPRVAAATGGELRAGGRRRRGHPRCRRLAAAARQRRLPGRARRARAGSRRSERRRAGGPARRRAGGDRDVLPGARGLATGCAAGAGPPGCDGAVCATGLGPEGATPAAIEALRAELSAERRRQGSGRHPVARRRAARAGRGCGSARCRRSGRPPGRVRRGRHRPAAPARGRVGSRPWETSRAGRHGCSSRWC